MSAVIEQMLKSYNVENIYDRKNAMKEIMQDVEPFIHDTSILNIWSSDFFRQITDGLKAV